MRLGRQIGLGLMIAMTTAGAAAAQGASRPGKRGTAHTPDIDPTGPTALGLTRADFLPTTRADMKTRRALPSPIRAST